MIKRLMLLLGIFIVCAIIIYSNYYWWFWDGQSYLKLETASVNIINDKIGRIYGRDRRNDSGGHPVLYGPAVNSITTKMIYYLTRESQYGTSIKIEMFRNPKISNKALIAEKSKYPITQPIQNCFISSEDYFLILTCTKQEYLYRIRLMSDRKHQTSEELLEDSKILLDLNRIVNSSLQVRTK